MNKLISLMIVFIMIFATFSAAIPVAGSDVICSGSCGDGLTWALDDDETLTISGTGSMYSFPGASAPWYEYKPSICKIVLCDGVTGIGNYAFENCENLEDVTLPEGLESIGDYAFYNCPKLSELYIPGTVSYIGEYAFMKCSALKTVTFGEFANNVTLKKYAFSTNLKSMFFMGTKADFNKFDKTDYDWANRDTYEYYPFLDYVVMYAHKGIFESNPAGNGTEWELDFETGILNVTGEGSVGSVESQMRNSFGLIKNVVISDEVKKISGNAFRDGAKIESVVIGDGVEEIGSSAFYRCTNLKSVSISGNSSLRTIGNNAFAFCSLIESFGLPAGIESIERDAFSRCSALDDLYFYGTPGDYLTVSIGEGNGSLLNSQRHYSEDKCGDSLSWVFDEKSGELAITGNGSMYDFSGGFLSPWYGNEDIKSVVVSGGVTIISQNAFYGCTGIEDLILPNSLKFIQSNAFSGCTSLNSVKFGTELKTIGSGAFAGCTNISAITLMSAPYLYANAFAECDSLTDVHLYGTKDDWNEIRINAEDGNAKLKQAEIHYFAPFIIGDADGDGEVTVKDILNVKKAISLIVELDEQSLINADVNCDGYVDMKDVLLIMRVIAD